MGKRKIHIKLKVDTYCEIEGPAGGMRQGPNGCPGCRKA